MSNKDRAEQAQKRAAEILQKTTTAQKRKRTQIVIIILACLAVIAVVAALIISSVIRGSESSKVSLNSIGRYADGASLVVGKNGLQDAPSGKVPLLTEYFDYACIHCAQVELGIGQKLLDDVKAGKYELELRPVDVVSKGLAWGYPATQASLQVAVKDPEAWEKFHVLLLDWFGSNFNQVAQGQKLDNTAGSIEKIKELAAKAGVKDSALTGLGDQVGKAYLEKTSKAWTQWGKDHGVTELGTPMFVANGKYVPLPSGGDIKSMEELFQRLYQNILQGLQVK